MLAVTAASTNPDDPLAGLVVGDHDEPEAPPGWEIIEVRAASLNHHDLWTLRGVGISDDQLPRVLGCDAAGVTADGREVVVHAVVAGRDGLGAERLDGDFSILSEAYDGTHSERVAVPSANLIDKPAALSFDEAACLSTAWLTAYRMLFTRAALQPGQHVLVQGAGGGVATAAITLAAAAGLRVSVATRDPAKGERAAELGAHEVVAAGGRLSDRVDAVIETVGEATWSHSLKSLKPGGRVVVSGATTGPNPGADLNRVFFRGLEVLGSTMGTRDELTQLLAFLAISGARPVVDATYPLADAETAYRRLADGEVFGKLVLTA